MAPAKAGRATNGNNNMKMFTIDVVHTEHKFLLPWDSLVYLDFYLSQPAQQCQLISYQVAFLLHDVDGIGI